MPRILFLIFASCLAFSAYAQSIAVVSFDGAMARSAEGKRLTARLETSMSNRRNELMTQQTEFERAVEEYQKGALVMSPEARAAKEQDLATQQASLQQAAMKADADLSALQTNLIYQLTEKLKAAVAKIALEKGYDIVLDDGMIPFVGSNVVDITDLLVQRYDAANP